MVSIPLALLGRFSNAVMHSDATRAGLDARRADPASPLGYIFEVFRHEALQAYANRAPKGGETAVAPLFDIYWQGYHGWLKRLPDHPAIAEAREAPESWFHRPASGALLGGLPLMNGRFTRTIPWFRGDKIHTVLKNPSIADAARAVAAASAPMERVAAMQAYVAGYTGAGVRIMTGNANGPLDAVTGTALQEWMHRYRPQVEWLLAWLGRDGVIAAAQASAALADYRRNPDAHPLPETVTVHGEPVAAGALLGAFAAANTLNFADYFITCPLARHERSTQGDVLEYVSWLFEPVANNTLLNVAPRDQLAETVAAAMHKLNRAARMPGLDLTQSHLRSGLPFYIALVDVLEERKAPALGPVLRELRDAVHPQLGLAVTEEPCRPAMAWEWLAMTEALHRAASGHALQPALEALRERVHADPKAGAQAAFTALRPCRGALTCAVSEAGAAGQAVLHDLIEGVDRAAGRQL